MAVLLFSFAALLAALVVLLGFVPGAQSRAARVSCTVVALLAGLVMAGAAVCASVPAVETGLATDSATATAEKSDQDQAQLPEGFSYVRDFSPSIEVELRYATTDNFTGQIVDGYVSTDAGILRTEAAEALGLVQRELEAEGLGLRVYDAFRPTRAVSFFMGWATTSNDSTKAQYYPDFEKPDLFAHGYIAEKSGHSLGGTVDLTLIDLASGEPLDMGGPFDFFGELSHYETAGLTAEQTANRARLHEAMLAQGFAQYPLEWWHYSYPLPAGTLAENFVVH